MGMTGVHGADVQASAPNPWATRIATRKAPSPVQCLTNLLLYAVGGEPSSPLSESVFGLVPGAQVVRDLWQNAGEQDLPSILETIEHYKRLEDVEELFKLQLKAATLGHIESMFEVGKQYLLDNQVELARQWFVKASAELYPMACLYHYMMCKDDPDYVEKLVTRSQWVALKDDIIQKMPTMTYEEELEARHFLALQSDVESMIILSKTYASKRDDESTLKWINKATLTNPNHSGAWYEKFNFLINSDPHEAFFALTRAAEKGHRFAIEELVRYYNQGRIGTIALDPTLGEPWKQKLNTTPYPKQYQAVGPQSSKLADSQLTESKLPEPPPPPPPYKTPSTYSLPDYESDPESPRSTYIFPEDQRE